MKKILLVILDGLGDRPNKHLGGKTPLQAAFRPNLNFLASRGINGLMSPVKQGMNVGSDTSHLSLLGYPPDEFYRGRGPFEAMGLGMDVRPGDVAFRANFATRESGIITDRRAGRIEAGNADLCRALKMEIDGIDFFAKEGVEHRAALLLRGKGVSDDVSDSDPHSVGKSPMEIRELSKGAEPTASALNKFLSRSREILDSSEVNIERSKKGIPVGNEFLIRGAGMAPVLPSFSEKYSMSGACVVGIPMIAGICGLAGLDIVKHPGATGRVDTDYTGKVRTAIQALESHDFVLLNIKATDVAGHDGDPLLKREVIEKIDTALGPLREILDYTLVAVTGDHSTPCATKEHSGDPVPITFASAGIRRDTVSMYDEISVSRGALKISGSDTMNYLLGLSDRSEKYGA